MLKDSTLILAASMPRSASTWLYNVVRLLLKNTATIAQDFSFGWIGDLENIPKKRFMLIKVHGFDQSLADHSRFIFYSFRDIRDVLASTLRKFGATPSIEIVDNLLSQHAQWMNVANFVMQYEKMLQDKEKVVTDIAKALQLTDFDPGKIIEEVENFSYDSEGSRNTVYHTANLYHQGHITDGRHGSWHNFLDDQLVRSIEARYRDWFDQYGYSISV